MSFFSRYSSSSRFMFKQLVILGVHIGHSIWNTHVYAAWMLYAFRQEVCLINLYKFIYMFRLGFSFIDSSIFKGRPIWFTNRDKSFDLYVRYFGNKCGEFSSTLYWIRGMVSNFREIAKTYKKNFKLSGLVKTGKLKLFNLNFKNWVLTRFTWPGTVFISSLHSNYFISNEATSAGIPCLGISDSDSFAQSCSIAIPGNDDSIDCIIFYNGLVAEYILYRKFIYIFLWFLNIRRAKRLISFRKWISMKGLKVNNLKNSFETLLFTKPYSNLNLNKLSLKLFFSRNSWLGNVDEQLTILKKKIGIFNISGLVNFFENSQKRYISFFKNFFFSNVWKSRRLFFYRRKFFRKRKGSSIFLRRLLKIKFFSSKNFKYLWFFFGLRKKKSYKKILLFVIHFYFLLYFFFSRPLTFVKKKWKLKVLSRYYHYGRRKNFRFNSRSYTNKSKIYGNNGKYNKKKTDIIYEKKNKSYANALKDNVTKIKNQGVAIGQNFVGSSLKFYGTRRPIFNVSLESSGVNITSPSIIKNSSDSYKNSVSALVVNKKKLGLKLKKTKAMSLKKIKAMSLKKIKAMSAKKMRLYLEQFLSLKSKIKILIQMKKVMAYALLIGFFKRKKTNFSFFNSLSMLKAEKFLEFKGKVKINKRKNFKATATFNNIINLQNKKKLNAVIFFAKDVKFKFLRKQEYQKRAEKIQAAQKKASRFFLTRGIDMRTQDSSQTLEFFKRYTQLSMLPAGKVLEKKPVGKALEKKPKGKALEKKLKGKALEKKLARQLGISIGWQGFAFKFSVNFFAFDFATKSPLWYSINNFFPYRPFIFKNVLNLKKNLYYKSNLKKIKNSFFFWSLNSFKL